MVYVIGTVVGLCNMFIDLLSNKWNVRKSVLPIILLSPCESLQKLYFVKRIVSKILLIFSPQEEGWYI